MNYSEVLFFKMIVEVWICLKHTRCSVSVSCIPFLELVLIQICDVASLHFQFSNEPKQVSIISCCITCFLSHKYSLFHCTHIPRSVLVRTWKLHLLSMATRSAVSVINRASWIWWWSKLSWSNKSSLVDSKKQESW